MIVVDSAALIAIALDQPEAERCMRALHAASDVRMSAATLTEVLIVAMGRACDGPVQALLDGFGLKIDPVTGTRARAAAEAYRRYGKGWHAASLNYGDSFAYALAMEHACPLLFVGDDFAQTDVLAALAG